MPRAKEASNALIVARCHEIQVSLGLKEVPEFENIPEIGMAVRLSLHIRGLPLIKYDVLRMVASYYLDIPTLALKRILTLLGEVEFVKLQTQGGTIAAILPVVPYYEDMYKALGQYTSSEKKFNEHEQIAIEIANRLSKAPQNKDSLNHHLGADQKVFKRILTVGTEGEFLVERRARGKDILLSPTYFSENGDLFADAVAATGAKSVEKVLEIIRQFQGWPLRMIEEQKKIGSTDVTPDQINLLTRLAQDGMIKPPKIHTTYSGDNYFLFSPTPSRAKLSPTKRDIYERAMAIVAAVRQGQLLPQKYAIRSPGAVIYTLRTSRRLKKATTEAVQQYKNLVHLRIGKLVNSGGDFAEFHIIDNPENLEALDIAYNLVKDENHESLEVDDDARSALQREQSYIESLIASGELRKRQSITLNPDFQTEIDNILLGDNLQ